MRDLFVSQGDGRSYFVSILELGFLPAILALLALVVTSFFDSVSRLSRVSVLEIQVETKKFIFIDSIAYQLEKIGSCKSFLCCVPSQCRTSRRLDRRL